MKSSIVISCLLVSVSCLGGVYEENSSLYKGDFSDTFVMRWAFQNLCDHVYDQRIDVWPTDERGVTVDPEKVQKGDILFVREVEKFLEEVHPLIKQPYIMVTSGEFHDRTLPAHEAVLDETSIIKWYSIHPCDYWPSERFEPIPLGVIQGEKFYKGRSEWGKKFARLRRSSKKHLLYVNFKKQTERKGFLYGNRKHVDQLFHDKPYSLTVTKRRPFKRYLEEMASCKFALSPAGLGPDCYRTWEALLVGTIPVVKSGPTDVLYKDLPVLIIDEWEDVTQELLEQTWAEFTSRKFNIEKLCIEYWAAKIYKTRDEYLKADRPNKGMALQYNDEEEILEEPGLLAQEKNLSYLSTVAAYVRRTCRNAWHYLAIGGNST